MDENYNNYNNNNQPYGEPYQPQQTDYSQQSYGEPYQPQQTDYNQQYQGYGSQTGYQTYDSANTTPEGPTGSAKTMSLICMICGIASVVLSCACGSGILPGIAAIVLNILAKKQYTGPNKQAQIGMILGIVGAALSVIAFIISVAVGCAAGANGGNYYY